MGCMDDKFNKVWAAIWDWDTSYGNIKITETTQNIYG